MQLTVAYSLAFAFLLFGSAICLEQKQHIDVHQFFNVDLGEMLARERSQQEREEKKKEEPKISREKLGSRNLTRESKSLEQVWLDKIVDSFVNNPNTKYESECFEKISEGKSVDFVIDLAPSPSRDNVDSMLAESPTAFYLERNYRPASRAYFSLVEVFIEAVTYKMKPKLTHSVIYDNERKFYIRGQEIDASFDKKLRDEKRNLETLWPSATKSRSQTFVSRIATNNLGRMTTLTLWNRDNGLPTVLAETRHSKPVYTIVITDGASGAKIHDLTDDLSRTTVIDIGNHRFIKNLAWKDMKELASFVTLLAPQQLPMLVETTRMMACSLATHEK